MIYTIRTTSGREDIVVDLLITKVKGDDIDIKSIFHPAEIKGYVFIEGTIGNVHKAMAGLMHSRGLIDKPINLGEIQHFLEYKKARIRVGVGDIVEIIGGPFKGEKGRVNRINKIKDEITAELLEASIPIPVTIATEFVKVVKKAHPEKVEKMEEKVEEKEEKSVFDKEELEKVEEKGKQAPKEIENPIESLSESEESDKLKLLMEDGKGKSETPATEEVEETREEAPSILNESGKDDKKKKKLEDLDE